jgi:predicted nucleic-acid-binding protein
LIVIGLDTNVLIRYLARDDEPAFQVANDLIRSADLPGDSVVIGIAVLLETEWVLRSCYKLKKDRILAIFDKLLSRTDIRFDDEAVFEKALRDWKNSSADFADAIIVAKYLQAGCTAIATFDRKASVLSGTTLLLA